MTKGLLPVQELTQPLTDSFASLGVSLNDLATKLEPTEPALDLPLLTDRLADYLARSVEAAAATASIKCETVLDEAEDLPLKKRSARKRKRVSYAENNDFSTGQGELFEH